MKLGVLIVALHLSFLATGFGASTNAPPGALARRLVQELGATEFRVRARAAEQLRALGGEAVPALEEMENAPDPEVRLQVQELLGDLRLGIAPDWPADLATTVRRLAERPPAERLDVLRRVATALQMRAVPFLMTRLASESREEQEAAVKLICEVEPREQAAREVLRWPKPAATAAQRRVRGWALGELGQTVAGVQALGEQPADDAIRRDLVEKAVGELQARLRQEPPLDVAKIARQLAEAVPNDSRFVHLHGLALVQGGEVCAGQALADQALALNPENEAAHFAAAEFLIELKQAAMAEQELELVLQIPPADDVYDLNAYFRLGPLQAQAHRYAEAAESYTKGLAVYRQARAAGRGMGLIGAEESQVEQQIAELRRLAGKVAQQDLTVRLELVLKDFDAANWRAATDGADVVMTVRVQPLGFRLFDLEEAGLRYDRQKKQLVPLLRNEPAGDPLPVALPEKSTRILVNSLDCYYVYEIEGPTGAARRLARLERDYRVHVLPGPRVRALRETVVTINGETNDWARLQAGAIFDYLPEKMAFEVRGLTTNGTWETIRQVVPIKEPPLQLLNR
ncbi:MAG: hypothetical protein PCFJNLEI_03386 [Verrucomicrobiae bacterium]|nr:hypothetical protein [Verrucomicrobiae bacterium]